MARTTPVSNGWTILTRPLGTIFPVADATMSIVPHHAHASAVQKSRTSVMMIARPIGDGGVSTISRAAGRNARSSRCRAGGCRNGMTWRPVCAGTMALADFMDPCLQPMQRRIAAACLDECLVIAVLDQTAALERDDAVHGPHRREPVGDDEDRAPFDDFLHVFLDDALAFVVEGAGRLVENQNARIGDERP